MLKDPAAPARRLIRSEALLAMGDGVGTRPQRLKPGSAERFRPGSGEGRIGKSSVQSREKKARGRKMVITEETRRGEEVLGATALIPAPPGFTTEFVGKTAAHQTHNERTEGVKGFKQSSSWKGRAESSGRLNTEMKEPTSFFFM